MLPLMALSVCLSLPMMTDRIIALRDQGVPEQQVREQIKNDKSINEKLRSRSMGVINIVYSRPAGSDPFGIKQHIFFNCDNKEILRGHQHSYERSRR